VGGCREVVILFEVLQEGICCSDSCLASLHSGNKMSGFNA
jgi:hypothetical protein